MLLRKFHSAHNLRQSDISGVNLGLLGAALIEMCTIYSDVWIPADLIVSSVIDRRIES